MHFTVILRGNNTFAEDYSYGLVLDPVPVWVRGDKKLVRLDGPKYREGDLRRLLEQEGLLAKLEEPRSATVVVHHIGLLSSKDLTALIGDLESEGFDTVCSE